MTREEKFVIFEHRLGTAFERYLYAVLPSFFASLFFSPRDDSAALHSTLQRSRHLPSTHPVSCPLGALVTSPAGSLQPVAQRWSPC